jgi:hypothetical protein
MFILAVIFAILTGFLIKGSLKNLENAEIKGIVLVILSFFIEFVINTSLTKGIIKPNMVTTGLDAAMYLFIFVFAYMNRKNPFLLIMSFGFFLNAFVIFINGGVMPASPKAMDMVNFTRELLKNGLYTVLDSNTKFWFLADIFPLKFITRTVVSIGDIIAAAGLYIFIILNMRKTQKS